MQIKTQGITLLELLITTSIIAIFFALAIPGYQELQKRSQAKLKRMELLRAIHLTRALAINYEQITTLCGSNDKKHCSSDWQSGHIILLNQKVQFAVFHSDQENVIHLRLFPHQLTQLQFLSSGKTNFQNGTFWYCRKNKLNPEWAIVINQVGRIRLIYPDESGNIWENDKVLQC